MFTRLGHFTVRRKRLVLFLSALVFGLSVVAGGGVFDRLAGGGFADPKAESTQAMERLDDLFDAGPPNIVLLITATGDGRSVDTAAGDSATGDSATENSATQNSATVDSATVAEAAREVEAVLADQALADDVVSYWSLGAVAPLRSDDSTQALVLGRFTGDEDSYSESFEELKEALAETPAVSSPDAPISVGFGGQVPVFTELSETIESDLARAESFAVPITLVLLIGVFGGLVAALLPVAVGVGAIVGAFAVLWLITAVTDVSVFSISLITAMGLGLAIDYSLFIVSRFREERGRGLGVDAAVVRTVETAGRTVAFSALTVAISLSALLIFPLYFLRSFAYAGIGVLTVAMVGSVVALPALLAALGPRVDSLTLWNRRAEPAPGTGFWHRTATRVMARPLVVATAVISLLVVLGLPFLRVEWGSPDDRVLPESAASRQVSEDLRTNFSSAEQNGFPVVVDQPLSPNLVDGLAVQLSQLDGVSRVDAGTGRYIGGTLVVPPDATTSLMVNDQGAWFNVVPEMEPISPEAEQLVRNIRDLELASVARVAGEPAEADNGEPYELAVGGSTAELIDSKEAIFSRVPLAALLIGGATFVLLFLMFGSLLVPAKALLLNLLSLTATFGAMILVFQDGNGSGLLGFTATGLTDVTTPILMFCIAFGLSMDYEVFLLSRIKEEYDRTGDNDAAVARGLEQTGRIVTAAAALLAVTFLAFATSGVTFIKLFGLGLAMAVLVDATIVRATLVPALMKLAGDANWWAPTWLRRVHDRFGISEGGPAGPIDGGSIKETALAGSEHDVDVPVDADPAPVGQAARLAQPVDLEADMARMVELTTELRTKQLERH